MNLCKYQNFFGLPNTGIHSYRLFNIAIIDVILTIFTAILFSYLFKIRMLYAIIGFFIFGILIHRLFCVRTTLDKFLFN
jgi:hypothetical protein